MPFEVVVGALRGDVGAAVREVHVRGHGRRGVEHVVVGGVVVGIIVIVRHEVLFLLPVVEFHHWLVGVGEWVGGGEHHGAEIGEAEIISEGVVGIELLMEAVGRAGGIRRYNSGDFGRRHQILKVLSHSRVRCRGGRSLITRVVKWASLSVESSCSYLCWEGGRTLYHIRNGSKGML